ncbi:hypothetical protein AN640_05060 [Candidatus Epulonipiscium fishelsonii]|uniref:Uncharacterized protein n=1 Tax=Candidatus Epulonipiscium fishelsonii TaxID=77094 RepID=A0ACC8XI57_9FIRM|nr:hypothetical protein AN640_05060 [Epulopiscium sp. SCG-D08WGA-EpuloA1]
MSLVTTISPFQEKNLELILSLKNQSEDMLLNLELSNITHPLIKECTIYRERGYLFYDQPLPKVNLGNLYPDEQAKILFKLNEPISYEQLELTLKDNFVISYMKENNKSSYIKNAINPPNFMI